MKDWKDEVEAATKQGKYSARDDFWNSIALDTGGNTATKIGLGCLIAEVCRKGVPEGELCNLYRGGCHKKTFPIDMWWLNEKKWKEFIKNEGKKVGKWKQQTDVSNRTALMNRAAATELDRLVSEYEYNGFTSSEFNEDVDQMWVRAKTCRGDKKGIKALLQLAFRGMNQKMLRLLVKMRVDYWRHCLEEQSLKGQQATNEFWKTKALLSDETVAFVESGVLPSVSVAV